MIFYLVLDHVTVDGTLSCSELILVLHGGAQDVPDVAHEDGEEEHAHHPAANHEDNLRRVLRLVILPDGGGCLGGEVKATEVSVSNSVIDKTIAAYSFIVRDGKVGAGI